MSGAVDGVLGEIEAWRAGKLWGCGSIAQFAGVSESTVVRWAKILRCPIVLCGGRYFVLRLDLMLWMTAKASKPDDD